MLRIKESFVQSLEFCTMAHLNSLTGRAEELRHLGADDEEMVKRLLAAEIQMGITLYWPDRDLKDIAGKLTSTVFYN